MMDKVSVIIPAHNGEKLIGRAIDSVLSQEGDFDIELIVVDDASKDETVEIAYGYKGVIVCHKNKRTGPNNSRNIGIERATGDYIAFLDQDDEWLPGKLQKQIKELKNGADLVSSQSINRMEKR